MRCVCNLARAFISIVLLFICSAFISLLNWTEARDTFVYECIICPTTDMIIVVVVISLIYITIILFLLFLLLRIIWPLWCFFLFDTQIDYNNTFYFCYIIILCCCGRSVCTINAINFEVIDGVFWYNFLINLICVH